MRSLESLRVGEWVVRERIADKVKSAIRLLEAINEISTAASAGEYPSRMAIAMSLAAGNVITVGVVGKNSQTGYRYELNDTGGAPLDNASRTAGSARYAFCSVCRESVWIDSFGYCCKCVVTKILSAVQL